MLQISGFRPTSTPARVTQGVPLDAPPTTKDGFEQTEPSTFSYICKKVGPFTSVVAGAVIGAGITALATSALSTGLALAAPAILVAGAAGIAIGAYRGRNQTGQFSSIAKTGYGAFHGVAGLAGGAVGKAAVLGAAAGGTAGLITGIAAAAVVGGACLWGISKGIEALLRR